MLSKYVYRNVGTPVSIGTSSLIVIGVILFVLRVFKINVKKRDVKTNGRLVIMVLVKSG